MKNLNRRVVILFSIVFIIVLAYGVMRFLIAQKEEPPTRRDMESRRFVNVEIIDYDTVLSPVSGPGRMTSVSRVNLSAEASGKIEQGDIMLKEGATFKKGELIFSIYSDEASLALKARKSQFMNTMALLLPDIAIDYPAYETSLRDFFNRTKTDRPLPPFPEIKDEKLNIFLASRNVLSEYFSIRKDELQLSRHEIRAPFDGTLTEVFLEVGAYTNTGGTVARAIRTDLLELEVPLTISDARWVKTGDPVTISSDERSYTWEGIVSRKAQVVDEDFQSRKVYIRIRNNAAEPVLAGEYLTATFHGRPISGVMEIPRNAVFNTNDIFLVKSNRLVKEKVNVVKVNTNTLLLNGPSEGDTLVVQPLVNVFEGTQVTTNLDPPQKDQQGRGY